MNNYTGEALRVKEKDGLEAEDSGIWSLVIGKGQRGRGRNEEADRYWNWWDEVFEKWK